MKISIGVKIANILGRACFSTGSSFFGGE